MKKSSFISRLAIAALACFGLAPAPVEAAFNQQNVAGRNVLCPIGDSEYAAGNAIASQTFTVAGGTGPYTQVTTGLPANVNETYATPKVGKCTLNKV